MTMDFYMLCNRPLISAEEWQSAIDDLGFNLKIPLTRDVATAYGAMTAMWRGEPVVFEFSAFPYDEIQECYFDIDFGQTWPNAYVMYTGSSFSGLAGAIMAGVAIVNRTGGRFFEPQESLILKPDEAVRYAHRTVDEVLAIMGRTQH
ncbi:hypothetical protein ACFQE0_07110 [Methylobacterium komagatae]|uniref:Uncharacterized protein n=1 Tax=Methylobacterium komagatae TaxID=374425 RepID=A0ABW2BGJ7_9HYPH